jgi:hypothetical protein
MIMDTGFIAEVNAKIQLVPDGYTRKYRFDFGGFGQAPLIEIARAIDEGVATLGKASPETKDRLLRYMLLGKLVKVFYEDMELGSFTITALDNILETIPVLTEHPNAYRLLADMAFSAVVEKSLPPRIATPPAAAERAAQRSAGSSGRQG